VGVKPTFFYFANAKERPPADLAQELDFLG